VSISSSLPLAHLPLGLINQARKSSYTATSPADEFPFVTPTGLLGSSAVGQETLFVAMEQLELMGQNFNMDYPAVYATTMAQGGFPTLGSFANAYHALPERNVPTTADFYDSDVAFAARRLTASPLYIKKVTNEAQIPFDKSTIVGLDEIIAPNNFAGLISSGKLFMVDFSVYGITSSDAAPNAAVEAPIGLFFVSNSDRLMPLAIKFTIQNTLTYSPKDSHADWFLAKAMFNMMDSTITALGMSLASSSPNRLSPPLLLQFTSLMSTLSSVTCAKLLNRAWPLSILCTLCSWPPAQGTTGLFRMASPVFSPMAEASILFSPSLALRSATGSSSPWAMPTTGLARDSLKTLLLVESLEFPISTMPLTPRL
jgi:hypothetical protein